MSMDKISKHIFMTNGGYCLVIIHQTFSFTRDSCKHATWVNMSKLKLGTIQVVFPNFQNRACWEKYLKDDKHDSLHLPQKHARMLVLGHYPFLKAHCFSWAMSSENCLLLRTGNVHGQNNIQAYFHPKWRLMFTLCVWHSCNTVLRQ